MSTVPDSSQTAAMGGKLPPSYFQKQTTFYQGLEEGALTSAFGEKWDRYDLGRVDGASIVLQRMPLVESMGEKRNTLWLCLGETVMMAVRPNETELGQDTLDIMNPAVFNGWNAVLKARIMRRILNALGVCSYATAFGVAFKLEECQYGETFSYILTSERHDGVKQTYEFPVTILSEAPTSVHLNLMTGEFFE